jgi:hypothetical protein
MTESENSDNEFEAFNHILLDEDETLEQLRHNARDITDVNVQFEQCLERGCGGDCVTVMFWTDEFDEASEYFGTCRGSCDYEKAHSVRFRSDSKSPGFGTIQLE